MIRDVFLTFALNQRPTVTPGANELPYFLPNGLTANNALDLQAALDIGRGRQLVARFEVQTTFAGAAGNTAKPFVMVADNVDLTAGAVIIARGPTLNTAALVAGTFVEVAIPELPSVALVGVAGKRFVGLGIEVLAVATDWTQGGLNAFILPSTLGANVKYTSGYTV